MTNDLLIGTSGYDYPEWKGVFYPEELKRIHVDEPTMSMVFAINDSPFIYNIKQKTARTGGFHP